MFDCDNDEKISYQDFIMFLATSGAHYAKSTSMLFNIGEKDKHQRFLEWDQVSIQSRNQFCEILENSLKLSRKLRALQEDYPIEVCKLKENMQSYID